MGHSENTSGSALTLQKPIGSGFGAASTAEEVIKNITLNGKVAIVTGGYSGLGRETVRVFSLAGAKVIVPARDIDKAGKALQGLDSVEIWPMDLMDPASITTFTNRFIDSGQALHILVNSAGIMASPLKRDLRGYESQFATNHLGHFQLVKQLWDPLQKARGARVVSVSSWGHHYGAIVFEDPNFLHRDYDPWKAYGQSKTANILFAVELDKRGKKDGIRAYSLHPGSIIDTGLGVHLSFENLLSAGVIDKDGKPILDPARNLKTVAQGAASIVWCATNPILEERGGVYVENCDIAPVDLRDTASQALGDSQHIFGVMPYAVDPELAERLWTLSEQLIS